MSDIFISYSRDDKPWVATLANALEAEGYDVWWDPEILPGQDFEQVIQEALKKTKCVLVVWSPSSVKSQWVRSESSKALGSGKLIPLIHQESTPPMPFDRIHTADFKVWKGQTKERCYQQLLRAIAQHSDKKPSPLPPVPSKKKHAWVLFSGALIIASAGGYFAWEAKQQKARVEQFSKVGNLVDTMAKTELMMQAIERNQSEEAQRKDKRLKEEAQVLAKKKSDEQARQLAEKQEKERLATEKAAKQAFIADRYIDNQNGTISDKKTGLMWKKCTEGKNGLDCSKGNLKEYKWNDVTSYAKQVSFVGHNNWRVPTIDELSSLVFCSNGTSSKAASATTCGGLDGVAGQYDKPTIDDNTFPYTEANGYWSSSLDKSKDGSAWVLAFNDGDSFPNAKNNEKLLRLVRSEQKTIDDRYIDNQNGTISDKKTGLMWKKCSEGQSGNNCSEGKAKEYKWDNAIKRFKHVSFASYSDWRMPTIEELRSLVYCSNGTPAKIAWEEGCAGKDNKAGKYQQPTINLSAFPSTISSGYWSSSPIADGADLSWAVDFGNGHDYWNDKNYSRKIRLVRSGQ